MKKLLWLIPVLLLVGCDDEPQAVPGQERFVAVEYSNIGTSCRTRIISDTKTGCEYLTVCNTVTAMPHTCAKDK